MTDVNQFILPPFEPRNPLRVPCAVLAVLFGATLVGGFWMFLERGKARSTARIAAEDLKAGQARIAALEADKAGLETEKEQLETEKAQLETVKSELESVKRELSKNAQAKDDEIAELKGISDKIQDKMKDDIAHGDLHLDQAGSSLRVVVATRFCLTPAKFKFPSVVKACSRVWPRFLPALPTKRFRFRATPTGRPSTASLRLNTRPTGSCPSRGRPTWSAS